MLQISQTYNLASHDSPLLPGYVIHLYILQFSYMTHLYLIGKLSPFILYIFFVGSIKLNLQNVEDHDGSLRYEL